jgi:hypothetical protein
MFYTIPSYSDCDRVIIAFKGLNNSFNHDAFDRYLRHRNACGKVFSYDQISKAIHYVNYVNNFHKEFELYGFSAGALSIKPVLDKSVKYPSRIITIGAYHSADVNFDVYRIKYKNFFDLSSVGQKNKGIFLGSNHFETEDIAVNMLIENKIKF